VFTESAELYDLIYSGFKDYAAEAARLAELLRSLDPACRTVLDVGCGSGEHARLLATAHGFAVDGIDLDPAFVRIARAKHPAGRFAEADMSAFHLTRRYDAILCLFGSIGYARTLDRLGGALRCFREHVHGHGVLVVEPWFAPGALAAGRHSERTAERPGVRVRRVGTTEIEGRISRLHFAYTIETADGTRDATETHELGLFTLEEMRAAFAAAGWSAEHRPDAFGDRGVYVARVAGRP
jgi:SAM-dependent methyltransferase